jgi:hypothetical protein
MTDTEIGMPPSPVVTLLRLEGLAAMGAAVAAYWQADGNWWIFAGLFFAPDLALIAFAAGKKAGAQIYNVMHTYTLPITLLAVGWFGSLAWLVPVALVWIAHIGMDRALGYGLKYPESFSHTHLGRAGKQRG